MAKKILIFISGVITGAVLMVFIAALFAGKNSVDSEITLFDKKGDCVSCNSFTVFQVLDNGNALANEINSQHPITTGLTVLFLNEDGKTYYDNQEIKIPLGKCAKQIGVFKYNSNAGIEKTVPIVEICDK